jgi:hypothetical protein
MEIDLLLVVMTEHAEYGILNQENSSKHLKDILMLFIVSNIIYHMGKINYNKLRDRIVTGSFDKTACIWNGETGE